VNGYPFVLTDRLVTTVLAPDAILGRLREHTDPDAWTVPRRLFFGTLSRERFVLHKAPRGANFFLPELRGDIRSLSSGSQIRLVVRVDPLNTLFVVAALICTIWWWVATTEVLPFVIAVGLTLLLWVFWFGPESLRAERALLGLLEAK